MKTSPRKFFSKLSRLSRIVVIMILNCLFFVSVAQAKDKRWKWTDYNHLLKHNYALVEAKEGAFLRDGFGKRLNYFNITPGRRITINNYTLSMKLDTRVNGFIGNHNHKIDIAVQKAGPIVSVEINGKIESMYYIWGGRRKGNKGNECLTSGFILKSDIINPSSLPNTTDQTLNKSISLAKGQLWRATVIPVKISECAAMIFTSDEAREGKLKRLEKKKSKLGEVKMISANEAEKHKYLANSCSEYGFKGAEENPDYCLMLYSLPGTYKYINRTAGLRGGLANFIVPKNTYFYYLSPKQGPKHQKGVPVWSGLKENDTITTSTHRAFTPNTQMSGYLSFRYGYVLVGSNKRWGWVAQPNLKENKPINIADASVSSVNNSIERSISLDPRSGPIGSMVTNTLKGFTSSDVKEVGFSSGPYGQEMQTVPFNKLPSGQIEVEVPNGAVSGSIQVTLNNGDHVMSGDVFFVTTPLHDYANAQLDHFYTISTDPNQFPPIPAGYMYQGIKCHVATKEVLFGVKLYRQWTPQKYVYFVREFINGPPPGVSVELGNVYRLTDKDPEVLSLTHDDNELGCKVFSQ